MDIIHQLYVLILTALPTFVLIILLTLYLKYVFFKPLGKVLQQRYEATEGARKLAEESLKRAELKTQEYEATLRSARSEIYQAQDKAYKEMQERSAAQLAEARVRADAAVREAKEQLAAEAESAKASLAHDSEKLANQIADAILERRAA